MGACAISNVKLLLNLTKAVVGVSKLTYLCEGLT